MPRLAWNRLVKVQDDQQTPATVAEYRYDGTNRRIRKYTDKSGDDWTVREFYYNASWQALEVSKDTKARVGGVEPDLAAPAYEQYVWSARYIDAPVLRDRNNDQDPDLEERLYYATDANMNVTALVDTDGTVAERYTYNPYGKMTVHDPTTWADVAWGNSKKSEVLYCGYRFDGETGLYHVRHRYLHPSLGRWVARDAAPYADGLSLYQHVSSTPTGNCDPFGLQTSPTGGSMGGQIEPSKPPRLVPGSQDPGHRFFTVRGEFGAINANCFLINLYFQGVPSEAVPQANIGGSKGVHWQLQFITSPGYCTPECYCCRDGSRAVIRFKQYLKRADAFRNKRGEWKPSLLVDGLDHIQGVRPGHEDQKKQPWRSIDSQVGRDMCGEPRVEYVLIDTPMIGVTYTDPQTKKKEQATGVISAMIFSVEAWRICAQEEPSVLDKVDFSFILEGHFVKDPATEPSWSLYVGSQNTLWGSPSLGSVDWPVPPIRR
jgi:RHS repeat-associated protein